MVMLWPKTARAAAANYSRGSLAAAHQQDARVYQMQGLDPALWLGDSEAPIARREALQVPALSRGVDLITTTLAGLPIERITSEGDRVNPGWIEQPEAGRPRFATLVDTVRDLLLDGRSYWLIHERSDDSAPRFGGVEYIDLLRVGNVDPSDPDARNFPITIDGKKIPARDVIGFSGWHSGIRNHGSRIIRTALALEKAAKRYADVPLPSMMVKNTSTYEMDDREIDALLAGLKAARNSAGGAVGYINSGLDIENQGWDAKEIQLVEARQFTNAQLCNLVGVPAGLIAGASAAGSTLTYQNVQQDNRAFIDFGLNPAIKAVETRLSMSDVQGRAWTNQVTSRGTVFRFRIAEILRGNPLERASIYASLIDSGIITPEEARLMEDLAPHGRQDI